MQDLCQEATMPDPAYDRTAENNINRLELLYQAMSSRNIGYSGRIVTHTRIKSLPSNTTIIAAKLNYARALGFPSWDALVESLPESSFPEIIDHTIR